MVKAYAKTDIGKARDINEDSFYITDNSFSDIQLYILADGMGGCKAGDIASKLAISTAKSYIENNIKDTPKEKESLIQLVGSSAEYANMVVYEKLIYNNRAFIAHIGDSRIYRIRNGLIRQLTQDHSYVQTLVKQGTITKDEAEIHPKKNILTKALGCNAFVEPDMLVRGFQKDDILVMCSDGLSNMVSQDDIFNIVTKNFEIAPKELVDLANKNGGIDNITIITIKNL